jgi:hydrogenase expression/formation protein HypC
MCLGIPARITAIDGSNATVRIGEIRYSASLLLLDNASVGDYIILHAGFAIEKVNPEEAAETIRLFEQIESDRSPEEAR